ncbi:MAG: hypothetical protein ACOCWM_00915 [Cyclobacteriaceae bacterium]
MSADGLSLFASGALINNTNLDQRPLFFTSQHATPAFEVENMVFRFAYRNSICGGPDDASYYSVNGATELAWDNDSDMRLVELKRNPSTLFNATYLGWTIIDSPPQSTTSIHHPVGSPMKISFGNNAVRSVLETTQSWKFYLNNGLWEHRSSGGPVLDEDNRFIGVIDGAENSLRCDNYDQIYSHSTRLEYAWSKWQPYLDPTNSKTTAINTLVNSPTTTIITAKINGPDLLCSSGEQYTLSNEPYGNVTWSASANISINSVTGFASAQSEGNGYVKASINMSVGHQFEINVAYLKKGEK